MSPERYDENLAARLDEGQLSVGGLCNAIFAIRHCELAIRFPARIISLAQPLNGVIKYMFLDKDLRPATTGIAARMENGIVLSQFRITPVGLSESGYFLGYEDSFDADLDKVGLHSLPQTSLALK